jgi:NADPH:quinone reductase-like Zn-dependent oxidoreductase
MRTIRAARLEHYGGVDAVRIEDIPIPELESGELLVRVRAAGVNPTDWKIRAGLLQKNIPMRLPATLGGDFSGVVDAVGPAVEGFKAGDEVYGQASLLAGGSGSFAEFAAAQAGAVSVKPRNVTHTESAALPLAGVAALQALTENLGVSQNQKVLVHGGAGGIGSFAVQLASYLGAHVATTVGTQDISYAKELGADTVVDYKSQEFEEVLHDLDAILDTIGGDTYTRSFKSLKRGGRLASMLEQPRQPLVDEFGVEASMVFARTTTQRLTRLAELVDEGAVKVNIDRTLPLAKAAAALAYLEQGSSRGKVVLTIA